MKVSIIISTYKVERFPDLLEILESLEHQSYQDFEVLVVVDGIELYTKLKDLPPLKKQNVKTILNEENYGSSL